MPNRLHIVSFVFLWLMGACKSGQTQPPASSLPAPPPQTIAPPPGIPAMADGKRAVEAAIDGPVGLALDGSGNLYISSPNENRVYKVGSDGILRLIGGNGMAGYSGDGGPAAAARLGG